MYRFVVVRTSIQIPIDRAFAFACVCVCVCLLYCRCRKKTLYIKSSRITILSLLFLDFREREREMPYCKFCSSPAVTILTVVVFVFGIFPVHRNLHHRLCFSSFLFYLQQLLHSLIKHKYYTLYTNTYTQNKF